MTTLCDAAFLAALELFLTNSTGEVVEFSNSKLLRLKLLLNFANIHCWKNYGLLSHVSLVLRVWVVYHRLLTAAWSAEYLTVELVHRWSQNDGLLVARPRATSYERRRHPHVLWRVHRPSVLLRRHQCRSSPTIYNYLLNRHHLFGVKLPRASPAVDNHWRGHDILVVNRLHLRLHEDGLVLWKVSGVADDDYLSSSVFRVVFLLLLFTLLWVNFLSCLSLPLFMPLPRLPKRSENHCGKKDSNSDSNTGR
jgi:hypothetical protein